MDYLKYDTLATNSTISIFEGITKQPCMFRTALCPDNCNHSKETAKFKIIEYLEYTKPGEYGDEKQEYFYANMNANDEENIQKKEFINFIKELKEGDKVKLNWDHIYVNNNGSRYPERPIRAISKV